MNSSVTGGAADIAVTPPDSLTRFDAPLFVGVERSHAAAATGAAGAKLTAVGADAANKLDDMINSMLPPRYSNYSINFIFETLPYLTIMHRVLFTRCPAENGLRSRECGCSTSVKTLPLALT
jgi:hypothetical protein